MLPRAAACEEEAARRGLPGRTRRFGPRGGGGWPDGDGYRQMRSPAPAAARGGAAVGRGSGNTRAIYSKVGTRRIAGDFLPYFGDFSGEKIGSEAGEVGC